MKKISILFTLLMVVAIGLSGCGNLLSQTPIVATPTAVAPAPATPTPTLPPVAKSCEQSSPPQIAAGMMAKWDKESCLWIVGKNVDSPLATPAPSPLATPVPAEALATPDVSICNSTDVGKLMSCAFMKNYKPQFALNQPAAAVGAQAVLPKAAAEKIETANTRAELTLPDGFNPVPSLIMGQVLKVGPGLKYEVKVPPIPSDLKPYLKFADVPDKDHPGPYVWGDKALFSFRAGDNFSCDDPTRWCSGDIEAFQWRQYNGEIVCLPTVGCAQNPGGAVAVTVINLLDSNETFDPETGTGIYVKSGYQAFGQVFDLSGQTYDLGMALGTLRNHWLYQLAYNKDYVGQCGSSKLCPSVLWIIAARVWNRDDIGILTMHYELIAIGLWQRP